MLYVPPDPLDAILELIMGDPPHTLARDRVFGGALPTSKRDGMPRATVVVRRTGAPRQRGNWGYEKYTRIDVRSYGKLDRNDEYVSSEASDLDRQIFEYLTTLSRPQEMSNGCLIYSFAESGGPSDLIDPESNFPFVLSIYDTYHSTIDLND